ncbi:alpha-N-acetylgalactosaminide alpha-2,6-sialyltransferase 2 isoform X1 [Phyllopteryx taeniolatus]|uniref:alpha-N-acetylgalactosaminide alpha-2,6-sialyltransferase 2 isoform X1 n=1 Tax=Phyllopteryx taeniolatus TaxID=161469 RepID=UPI002AD53EA6|nr:alpha-N-acetylgalactosaminide alpha-2,6-sialyltransferase 2 isoform X1 [Phyllopteryx taeniolatus]XP_061611372.1 alpha-N-acetylgalactosaminide alpha-2,6-sialyltransferase 2 isoform X1 [Phyllopteryx taeniolatus]
MSAQRRLALAALSVASVLGVYFLSGNLETPLALSWSHLARGSLWSKPRDSEPRLQGNRTSPAPSPAVPCGPTPVGTTLAPAGVAPSHKNVSGKPTEPPFIGDAYASEDVPPQTDCPDGIRNRIPKSDFAGLFLNNVPVLQWSKHATADEYRRLRPFAGANGWGGLTFQTLSDALAALNRSANAAVFDDWKGRAGTSRCIRCAVVGNGGILRDSKKGEEIDRHHYVFRTNGAILAGFEEDVGVRSTHYTFSTNTLINSMRSYASAGYRGPPRSQETRYVFLPDHDRDYQMVKAAARRTLVEGGRERGKDPTAYFGKDVTATKLKMYHPDFVRYLRNRFLPSQTLKTKHKNIYRPSTGAVMLLAALHACDRVSAYGFMTPQYKDYSDHYYDNKYRPVGFFVNHDLMLEMNLWQRLHRAGLITLYMRS